jgi:hypothetical protein
MLVTRSDVIWVLLEGQWLRRAAGKSLGRVSDEIGCDGFKMGMGRGLGGSVSGFRER